MDEWQLEMNEIRHRLGELRAHRRDPVIMDELEAQLRILRAFYESAQTLFEVGNEIGALRRDFPAVGFGEWSFENVYSFIYEYAMQIELGNRDLGSLIPEVDYAALIKEAAR